MRLFIINRLIRFFALRRPVLRLSLLSLSLLSVPAWAQTLSDLYLVREPVASQQPEERPAALGRALDTLVLRLTGDPKAAQNPALAALRKDPQQLILRFNYEDDALLVEFDPASTSRSLRKAGLALWGANRPLILTWWLNETNTGTQLLGDDQSGAALVRAAAQHRGLPLRLPLADLNEQLLATADNLAARQSEALQTASERYAADAVLAVHAREADGQWQAQWQLWLGESREQGSAQGADAKALADAVLLAVSTRLASRFVAAPGAAESLTLDVRGVTLAHYAELQQLLEPFEARLKMVEGERLVYQVNAAAEPLRAQLALARLQEVSAEQAAAEDAAAQALTDQAVGQPGAAAADAVTAGIPAGALDANRPADSAAPAPGTAVTPGTSAAAPPALWVPRGKVLRFRWTAR
jgi:hypothetical protein